MSDLAVLGLRVKTVDRLGLDDDDDDMPRCYPLAGVVVELEFPLGMLRYLTCLLKTYYQQF